VDLQKRVEHKLLLHVASVVFLLYFFFAIDRGNVGFAALQMNSDLGLSAEVFGYGSALFTLAYLLFQAPNAEALRRLGARRGFAIIACAWGVASLSTAFVSSPAGFLVNRLVLGMAEAGFHAFMVYYISRMFPSRVRGFAVGVSFIAVPCSMIVASPLSGALLDVEIGGMSGWQSLFVIEGVPSVLLGLLCLKIVPDSPAQARFLTDEERAWLTQELSVPDDRNEQGSALRNIGAAIANPLVWALGFVLFTMVLAINVMTIWMPLMIKQVSGAGNLAVGVLNALPWVTFSIGCIVGGRTSDKVNNRATPLRIAVAIATLGFFASAALQEASAAGAFAAFLLACVGAGGAQGVFWALAMQLIEGRGTAAAFAMITVVGSGSGVFAHPLIGRLHDSTGSFDGVVWTLTAFYVAAFATLHWIARDRGPDRPAPTSLQPGVAR
jgi:MFS family permease